MNENSSKSTPTVILLVICLAFGGILYYQNFYIDHDKEIEKLRVDNARLESEIRIKEKRVDSLQVSLDALEIQDSLLHITVIEKESEVSVLVKRANRSQAELSAIMKELESIRRKIDSVKHNPPNRTGDDLLNSLKIKTMK